MIKTRINFNQYKKECINLRKEFHKMPEPAFEEIETSKRIASYLTDWGLEVTTGIAKTGVVGLLRGKKEGKTIAVRADIDGLPVKENTNLDYSSNKKGYMHACGHDGHISIALQTAKILSNFKNEIKGNVKFIFQPAEEIVAGAALMIKEGVLKDPDVDAIIGLHIWPELESGFLGVNKGPVFASADRFDLIIKGKSGHGALPHQTKDPSIVLADIINGFQKIISRELSPLEPGVISFGMIKGGSVYNIIPSKIETNGTIRSFNSDIRELIPNRMEEIAYNICKGYQLKCDYKFSPGVPVTLNNEEITDFIIKTLRDSMGSNLIKTTKPTMGGEDFSLFLEEVPGTYMLLGTKNEKKGITGSIHQPNYDIDNDILIIGVKAFILIILNYLNTSPIFNI